MISRFYMKIWEHRRDITIVLCLAAVVWIASYHGGKIVGPILTDRNTQSSWFEADIPRVFENMTQRWSNHYRTKVHPLFSLVAFSPVFILNKILGFRPEVAVRIIVSTVASLWISLLFVLLRIVGCRRFDAILVSFLGMTSAAAVFWLIVPETYAFGSLSILLALLIVAVSEHRDLSSWWYISTSALTLSFTTSNWMVGILATLSKYRWKRAIQITVNAFALVTLLWGFQKFFFSSAKFFIGDREEIIYMFTDQSGGALRIAASFFFHSIVMPAINVVQINRPYWPVMLIQKSLPGSGTLYGFFAVWLWGALFILSIWALFKGKSHLRLRIVLVLSIIGQLGLHLIYGQETFLYALHFTPLLIMVVGLATLTSARKIILILLSASVMCAGINNFYQLKDALSFLRNHGTQRQQVRSHMIMRPKDPWPRGEGHVILAIPGSKEKDKAYHEPGCSFSPAVGSFGISIWVTDPEGNIKTTSDNIPLKDIKQRLKWPDESNSIPGIDTETPNYDASWHLTGPNSWKIDLNPSFDTKTKYMLVVRSVGPAGGPVNSLEWNGEFLKINESWTLKIEPTPAEIRMGNENKKGWITGGSVIDRWEDESGWGYARLTLADNQTSKAEIRRIKTSPTKVLDQKYVRTDLKIDLPDRRFMSSLDAQVAHLMMGLVDRETRPGDPMNYPLSWLRDGAYVIVALARAGQLDSAKKLSIYLAENDFFGGFGAEADAPGLALWALEEVAVLTHQMEFDQQLWPHVERKAKLILEFLSAKDPILQPSTGPMVPKLFNEITKSYRHPSPFLVVKPARDGLIIGKMDNHWPLLFVNAINFRGLLAAASLADRLNHSTIAAKWRSKAMEIQKGWINAFKPPESLNERTYISGLWHTWIARSIKNDFKKGLWERWINRRDSVGGFLKTPLWTYFDISEAHQWLYLDQADRVWATLDWFWNNQASQGLYTWWEGSGETNTFHRWDHVRGWINPDHVTPHYWTAAEMVLLQLDMLAYIDETEDKPIIVIGEGIKKAWLNSKMSVNGLLLSGNKVDWNWNREHMHVVVHGGKIDVRLGSVFPTNTPLDVEYTTNHHETR